VGYEVVDRRDLMTDRHTRHMVMALSDEEWEAIMELSERMDLMPVQVMRQALRVFQLQQAPLAADLKLVLDKKRGPDVDSDAAAAAEMMRDGWSDKGHAENHHT